MRRLASVLLALAAPLAGCAAPASDSLGAAVDADEAAVAAASYEPGWPPLEDAVVRPGAKAGAADPLVGGHFCTLSFVYGSPDNRTLYVSLSSHCLRGGYAVGDEVPLAGGAAVGVVAYCSYGAIDGTDECTDNTQDENESDWNDFALLRIPDEHRAKVHPAMLKYGGPTGLSAPRSSGDRVLTYGNTDARDLGKALPDPLDGRPGVVTGRTEWITEARFAFPGVPGDSGSPVLAADGGAVGVLKYLTGQGVNGVTNLDAALAFLHENTDLRVELKTWPLLDERPL